MRRRKVLEAEWCSVLGTFSEHWKTACMVPRLSSLSILSNLARDRINMLPSEWKKYFVQYGLAIAALQRAGRLLAVSGEELDLLSELQNISHQDTMILLDFEISKVTFKIEVCVSLLHGLSAHKDSPTFKYWHC